MIEIENILNAAKGAAGAKKSITTLFSVDFATISDSSNLKKIACGAWHTCPVAHMLFDFAWREARASVKHMCWRPNCCFGFLPSVLLFKIILDRR